MFFRSVKLYVSVFYSVMQFITCKSTQRPLPVLDWQVYNMLPGPDGQDGLGVAGPVSGIYKGKILVAGGANFPEGMPWEGGKKQYYSEAFVFGSRASNAGMERFNLPYKIAYSASVSLTQGVLCIGGENETGPVQKVLLIEYERQQPNYVPLPPLPVGLSSAAAAVVDSTVYLAGGEGISGTSDRLFKLDLKALNRGWQQLGDIPHPVSHAVMVVAEASKLYLMGGRRKTEAGISILYRDNFVYYIGTGQWGSMAPMPYALSAGTAALISDHLIALLGGDRGATFHQT